LLYGITRHEGIGDSTDAGSFSSLLWVVLKINTHKGVAVDGSERSPSEGFADQAELRNRQFTSPMARSFRS
jgi:hypothetical protein